jgi:predicted Zn-dependent protease
VKIDPEDAGKAANVADSAKPAAQDAYAMARPYQQAYVDKWPDDPNPLSVLAFTDAALGRKEDAIREASQALARLSHDAVSGPLLAENLAQVYLWVGEPELALRQLEALERVPRAFTYGFLSRMPDWDELRSEPRFQSLLARLGPLPIENRNEK